MFADPPLVERTQPPRPHTAGDELAAAIASVPMSLAMHRDVGGLR